MQRIEAIAKGAKLARADIAVLQSRGGVARATRIDHGAEPQAAQRVGDMIVRRGNAAAIFRIASQHSPRDPPRGAPLAVHLEGRPVRGPDDALVAPVFLAYAPHVSPRQIEMGR